MYKIDDDKFSNAIFEIALGIENEDSANYLDQINSSFIYHKNINDYSNRELLCDFMINNKIDSTKDLDSLYFDYVNYLKNVLKVDSIRILNFDDFKDHIILNKYFN